MILIWRRVLISFLAPFKMKYMQELGVESLLNASKALLSKAACHTLLNPLLAPTNATWATFQVAASVAPLWKAIVSISTTKCGHWLLIYPFEAQQKGEVGGRTAPGKSRPRANIKMWAPCMYFYKKSGKPSGSQRHVFFIPKTPAGFTLPRTTFEMERGKKKGDD